MTARIEIANLKVNQSLFNFIEQEVLPSSTLDSAEFWSSFSKIIEDFAPVNNSLLEKREQIQTQIDNWHKENDYQSNFTSYKSFLQEIGYLVPEVEDFSIETTNVDAEVAELASPQLVVPIMNARFALNAVNARWGSLYDALYGTNVICESNGAEKSGSYNPVRGQKVIEYARDFLDSTIPLESGSHHDVTQYEIINGTLQCLLENNEKSTLKLPSSCIGSKTDNDKLASILFSHNGTHFEIQFDAESQIGKLDKANVSDVLVESALSTIMDCEDSVAAVDGEDKLLAYKNWFGLIHGTLTENIEKNGTSFVRKMAPDRQYTDLNGNSFSLKGRALMFIRNVGHLMTNNAILDANNNEVPEGILDAVITSLIARHDVVEQNLLNNSAKQSIYIVKPKMHGPEEVAFADTLFSRVEKALALPANTIKMGIMDEERRTSVNLKACIHAAKQRVAFINTGFLDRTGDEIHTSMQAGAIARKADIKNTLWIDAYERSNVDIGLSCGLSGKAQIGKGMWAIPNDMASMMETKITHPKSGANTAWVPSPTAATLHALHYHQINVSEQQEALKARTPANVDEILTIPLAENTDWSEQEINDELDNNAQGILGYVVRWIDQGIGCSTVPDINNIGLMEDRATLRISSQHIANWLEHNICSIEQVNKSLAKMARVVDEQNKADPLYQPMSDDLENSIAFNAAKDLVFKGTTQPSGYTEPLLHQYRLVKKQAESC